MSFSPLDSNLLGPFFRTASMVEIFSDRASLEGLLKAECALAKAQASLGLVDQELEAALRKISPDQLDEDELAEGTESSGVLVIPFVKQIEKMLGPEMARGFHYGTTTQDMADTASVLQWRAALQEVGTSLEKLCRDLGDMARRHASLPCMGRTSGQHAAPVSFGYKASLWALALAEHLADLPRLRKRVLVVSLGGPVGTLSAYPAEACAVTEAFANELGLGVAAGQWHSRRAQVVELGAWLAILLGILGKMATDIAAMAATEVGELAEPAQAGRGGSSAMPHKRNPIGAMAILAAHKIGAPQMQVLLSAMASQHERPLGEWHTEWFALPALFGLVSGALREAERIGAGLEINAEAMRANIMRTRGLVFSDRCVARLTPALGRAEAYAAVQHAAKRTVAGEGNLEGILTAQYPALRTKIADAFDMSQAIEAARTMTERTLDHSEALLRSYSPQRNEEI